MQTSAQKPPVLLKTIGLIALSGIAGVYMGWSAVDQIDPFYYTPRTHGSRYVPDQAESMVTYGQPSYAYQPYRANYPYAPEPPAGQGIDPATPADPIPDAVTEDSDLRIAAIPEPGGCTDCGGPYEEIPPSGDGAPPVVPGDAGADSSAETETM